jgi:hypothetical protein
MIYIYILELENNKYYVGKTTIPNFRLEQHFNSLGSSWTKKYKPIKILELKPNCDNYDEDKYTRMYMDMYGVNNVRGGSYVKIKLDKITIENLERMNKTVTDKCFSCGSNDHFAKNCNHIQHNKDKIIIYYCNYCNKEFDTKKGVTCHENLYCKNKKILCYTKPKINICYKCGRDGHYSNECYALKHINGKYLY